MAIDDTILREQLRQQERKKAKQMKAYAKKKKKKLIKNEDEISVNQFKKLGNDSAKRKAEERAWEWFSRYIRLRDLQVTADGKIFGNCIACGKRWDVEFYSDKSIINAERWNASHYFRQDMYESTKYDETNCNLSCYNCNRNLGGNLNLYKINLVKKVGVEEFEKLETRRNNPKNYNILELIKIKEKYMDKVKTELRRLKIKL